jgi:hypothetical protein
MLFAFVGLRTDWLPPGVPFSCGAETDWLPPTYRLLSFRRKVSGEWTLGWGDASVINQLFTDYQEAGVPSPRDLPELMKWPETEVITHLSFRVRFSS